MQKQKWLSFLGIILVPFLLIGCGVTVANENYVRVGFIDVENTQIELATDNPDVTETINYRVVPANATVRNVTFKSMNENIVTVDEKSGVVSVAGETGITTIKITSVADKKVTAEVKVQVVPQKSTLATPENVRFDAQAKELMWDPVRVDSGSYYEKLSYKLEVKSQKISASEEEAEEEKTFVATTYNTKYSNFNPDTIYTVRVQAIGNKTSYLDSSFSESYSFAKLSDPNNLELVRVSNFGITLDEHCQISDALNEEFKVRFELNPLFRKYLIKSEQEENTASNPVNGEPADSNDATGETPDDNESTPDTPTTDEPATVEPEVEYDLNSFYTLNVVNSTSTQNDEKLDVWAQAFSSACVRLCEQDGKYYGCFSVPNGISNWNYSIRVNIKSEILLKSLHLFSNGNANTITVSQLKEPTDLVLRSVDEVEQLSWNSAAYAAGYVLQFVYKFAGSEAEVKKNYTILNTAANRNEIRFTDILANQDSTNPVLLENYTDRKIYIYTLAHDTPYGGISYTDSALSTTPALIQLPDVTGITYTRDPSGDKGLISWDKCDFENCHYQVYISSNTEEKFTGDDTLILSGDGLVLENNRVGVEIENTSSSWKNGSNYLKIMVSPKSVDAGTSNQKYMSSNVVVSGGFYKINSVDEYTAGKVTKKQFTFKAPELVDNLRTGNLLEWIWEPDSFLNGKLDYSTIIFQVQFTVNGQLKHEIELSKNGQMKVVIVDLNATEELDNTQTYLYNLDDADSPFKSFTDPTTGKTKFSYNLNDATCPLDLKNDSASRTYKIAIKVISEPKTDVTIPDGVTVWNLIDSEESYLTLERYASPEIETSSTGVLAAKVMHDRKIIDGETITIQKQELKLNTYEVKIANGEPILFQDIDTLAEVLDGVMQNGTSSNKLAISIRAVSLNVDDPTIEQSYLSDDDTTAYFIDGNWSSQVNIFKLDAPKNIRVENGVVVWDEYRSNELSNLNVCYFVEIFKGESQTPIIKQTVYQNSFGVSLDLNEDADEVRVTVRTLLSDTTNKRTIGGLTYYIINSERSIPTEVQQCAPLVLSVDVVENTLSWQKLQEINSYVLRVKKGSEFLDDIMLSTGEDMSASLSVNGDTITYDLSNWAENEGTYTFYVYGCGDTILNGVKCDGKELVKLSAPILKAKNGMLYWTDVSYQLGSETKLINSYTLKIDLLSGESSGSSIYKTISNSTSTTLDDLATQISNNQFNVSICSDAPNDSNNVISSVYSLLEFEINGQVYTGKIYKWVDVASVNVGYDYITWEFDDSKYMNFNMDTTSPTACLVSLTIAESPVDDAVSTTLRVEKKSGEFKLDLSKYQNYGHYEVRIQPLGLESNKGSVMFLDGQMSRAYTFERLPSTDKLRISRIDDEPIIEWEKATYSRLIKENISVDLAGDYKIVLNKKLDNGSMQKYEFSNIIAKSNGTEYLQADVIDGVTTYKIKLKDLKQLYSSSVNIDISSGEFLAFVQTIAKTNEQIKEGTTLVDEDLENLIVLDSMLSSAYTSLFIFSAPNVVANSQTGFLNISKTFQKSNTVSLKFSPVVLDNGTSSIVTDSSKIQIVDITNFFGWSYEYDVTPIENIMKNQNTNYVGFVLDVRAVGNATNYVSSDLVSTKCFYQRLLPVEYKFLTNDSQSIWYVDSGTVYWSRVDGATAFEIKATSTDDTTKINSILVDATVDLIQSKELKTLETGNYNIQFRALGGDNREARTVIGETQYYKAYLASVYSSAKQVQKLAAPGNPRILTEGDYKGEFDFGERDASGNMKLGFASAYIVKYQAKEQSNWSTWTINSTNASRYFIASEEFGDKIGNVFDLSLIALGNTPTSNTDPCYISSGLSTPFTLYLPARSDDIGFTDSSGSLTWKALTQQPDKLYNVELQYTVGGVTKYLRTDNESLKLKVQDDDYLFDFENNSDVKGKVASVKVRYSGQKMSNAEYQNQGIVNSIWSNEISVYKLLDFVGNDDYEGTKLWCVVNNVNDGDIGKLAWSFGDEENYRNATITINDLNSGDKFEEISSEMYELNTTADMTKIEIFIQNMAKKNSYKYKDGAVVLNSDIASQMFYKVNNITSFYTFQNCRIGWKLENATVDEGNIIEPQSLIVYYKNENDEKSTKLIPISASNKESSVGMWEVGNFSGIYARAVGVVRDASGVVVGMTLASNKKDADGSTNLNFSYFADGSGTAENPYVIEYIEDKTASLVEQLGMVRFLSDMFFIMESDIELNDIDAGNNFPNPDELSGTKYEDLIFIGGFNGNGHKISNIKSINESSFGWWNNVVTSTPQTEYDETKPFFGLNGIIYNLKLEARSIDVSGLDENSYSGLLTKENQGYIIDCEAYGYSNSVFTGSVGVSLSIGGLVGLNISQVNFVELINKEKVAFDAVIQGCKNYLPINISSNTGLTNSIEVRVGGILGIAKIGRISDCENHANLSATHVGGIVGRVDGAIKNGKNLDNTDLLADGAYILGCVNFGEIKSVIYQIENFGWHGSAGGIAAYIEYGEVVACLNNGAVINENNIVQNVTYIVGGIAGEVKNSVIAISVQNYSYTDTDFAAFASGDNAYIWSIANVASDTPVIYCAWTTGGGKIATSTNWKDCMDLSNQPKENLEALRLGTNDWSEIVRLDGKRAYIDKTDLNNVKIIWALNTANNNNENAGE